MIGSRNVLRRAATFVVVAAIAVTLAGGVGAANAPTAGAVGTCFSDPSSCRSVLLCPIVFEALIGSGERWLGDDTLTPDVSPALYTVYQNVVLPPTVVNLDQSQKIYVSVVNYGQDGRVLPIGEIFDGRWWWPPRLASNVSKYLGGEYGGVDALWNTVEQARSKCSTTRFILAGYSQGAMVVHDFLNHLAASGDTDLQASIIGAVLVGDPDRVMHSKVPELSTAPNSGYGLCDVVITVSGVPCPAKGPLHDIDPMFLARTVSVCGHYDAACDTSDLLGAADLVTSVRYGSKVHESYQFLPATGNAGAAMSQLLAAALRWW